MGRTVTPKYRVEMIETGVMPTKMAWKGRATDEALRKYVFAYADSLKAGGVNEHVAKALGFVPFPQEAKIVNQFTNEVVATWKAATFQVF